jgi:hypothetical protein
MTSAMKQAGISNACWSHCCKATGPSTRKLGLSRLVSACLGLSWLVLACLPLPPPSS